MKRIARPATRMRSQGRIRLSQKKTPLTILRHAALLLAEQEQDRGVEEIGDAGGEQHGALLALAAPDDGAEEEALDQRAEDGERQRRGEERDDERQLHQPVDFVGDEAAEHVHLPVREIEHVHQREDQRQAERDQRILRAEVEPVGDDLFHRCVLRAVIATAAKRRELRRAARVDPSARMRIARRSRDAPRDGGRCAQSTLATNRVLNLPSSYSLTTSGTASCRFWPNDVVPT